MIPIAFYTILVILTLVMLHALIKAMASAGSSLKMAYKKTLMIGMAVVIGVLIVWLIITGRLNAVGAAIIGIVTFLARGWRFIQFASILKNAQRHFSGFSFRSNDQQNQNKAKKRYASGTENVMSLEKAAKILGVPLNADEKAIKRAWRQKLHKAHPDKGGSVDHTQRLNRAKDLMIHHALRGTV